MRSSNNGGLCSRVLVCACVEKSVSVGSRRVNLVDAMSSHLLKTPLDVESQCACVCLCLCAWRGFSIHDVVVTGIGEIILKRCNTTATLSSRKSTHLYVICLCCHFCPVRAYRRFLTLNLATPPIWSGTPHLGFFIHLQWRQGMSCIQRWRDSGST